MAVRDQPPLESVPVRAEGVGRENQVLRELVAIYHHLTGLALQSAELETVAKLLAERTAELVAIVSPTLDVLAAGAAGRGPAEAAERAREFISGRRLGRVVSVVARTRRPLRLPAAEGAPPVVVAPILVGDDILACLLTVERPWDEPGEDVSLLVTEHAATICGVIMSRERVVAAAAARVRDDLVEGLLLGRAAEPEEVDRWAQHLGYDPNHAHRVISVALEDATDQELEAVDQAARRRRILDGLARFAGGRAPDAIVAVRDRELVIVAREHPGSADHRWPAPRELGDALLAHARRLYPGTVLIVGIGGVCRRPSEIARSYAQARRTIGTSRRLGRHGEAVAFEDLGIHRLLLQVPDLDELRAFAEEVIGPLLAHERQHHSGYLKTLAVYLRENGSLQRAARQLHVHPNTVTYRLNRVRAICGLDLDRYQDRLLAQVALEIVEALGDR
ncbi:MAG TPA: helix-turn-helix domain-containing protein [Candidatus Dormibacteraeota bacterium]|jgi:sugar diacid utilization regulator|nr:helix-turn-helix domain-containing protein [Candidatus Dormibacteraeota bacterium]